MVGDGYCHDEANNADCDYDGGDCCGSCVVKDFCTNCTCESGDTTNTGEFVPKKRIKTTLF